MADDRPRILLLIMGLAIGEPMGGAERFGVELALHLNRSRFEPIVCGLWCHGVPSERYWLDCLAQAGIETFLAAEWEGGLSVSRYAQAIKNIAVHFQNRPVDLIHSHFQLGSVAALLLKRPLGARAIVRTAHAGKEWGDTHLAFFCRQVFTNWVFPLFFDLEVSVSCAQVEALNRRPYARLVGKKAVLSPNALSLVRFNRPDDRVSKRKELGLPADSVVVGSVGRLREEKGYAVLLDAAVVVRSHIPQVRFLIVGDGELREALQKKAEQLGLTDMVIFTGARVEVESFYDVMDIFVLPSLWEGLSTVILESMASRVPVVATDLPGTRELVQPGRTGWLVKPGDPASLANGILQALSSPIDQTAFAQAALLEVVPRFSIEHVAGQYEQIYLKLLASKVQK